MHILICPENGSAVGKETGRRTNGAKAMVPSEKFANDLPEGMSEHS